VILLALFIVLIYVPHLNQVHLLSLILLIGFFCGAETLCFNAALRYTDSHTSGLTIGVVNTLNMAGGAIMQQAIGVYLDATWQGSLDINGLRIYSLQEFVEAFSILVIILFICAIIACTALSKNKKFGI
jgi:MFS family permease